MIWFFTGVNPQGVSRMHTIFFYGDGEAGVASELRMRERDKKNGAVVRDASAFSGETEPCDRVVILDGVAPHHATLIERAYAGLIKPERGSTRWDGGLVAGGPLAQSVGADALEVKQESADIHGPKAEPDQVSLKAAEVNLRPKFEEPPPEARKPPQRPRRGEL